MHAIKTDFDSASYEVAWFKSNWNRVVLEAWDNGNIFYALSIISPGWNYDISLLAMLSLECWHGTFNTSTIEHHKDRDCLQLYSQDARCLCSQWAFQPCFTLWSFVFQVLYRQPKSRNVYVFMGAKNTASRANSAWFLPSTLNTARP